MAYLTAWHMLVTRAEVCPEDDVLILSAGSGRWQRRGCKLPNCAAPVFSRLQAPTRSWNARDSWAPISQSTIPTPISARLSAMKTEGRGVDVVFEHVGAATWDQSIACLAKNGRLVSCGVTTGNVGEIDIRKMYQKQLTLMGSALGYDVGITHNYPSRGSRENCARQSIACCRWAKPPKRTELWKPARTSAKFV